MIDFIIVNAGVIRNILVIFFVLCLILFSVDD